MPITINGSGSVTGISAGGLPDDCITTAEIAANAVTTAKLGTNEASGLAKAFVNFNGTGTVAIRASFNVSSITDNGTGDYTVNFTTAMPDANYSMFISSQRSDGTISGSSQIYGSTTYNSITTGSLRVFISSLAGTAVDNIAVCTGVFR